MFNYKKFKAIMQAKGHEVHKKGKFFKKNNHVIGVQNSMKTIEQLEEKENFKFYKNRNRQKYIEVTRQ